MIICHNDLCIYNSECRGCTYEDCKSGFALIIDDDGCCDCFEDFRETKAYQNPFFKAVQREGRRYKVAARGAITEINGFILYYEGKELTPQTYCTEKESGICGKYEFFADTEKTGMIRHTISNLDYGCAADLPLLSGELLRNR